MKKSFLFVVGCMTTLSLFGCSTADQGKDGVIDDDTVRNVTYENGNNKTKMNDVNDTQDVQRNEKEQYNQSGGMRVADVAADRIVALKNVKDANVIVTDHTAYVAAVLDDNKESNLTKDMEHKIAHEVRKADGSVHRVFVSTNPDFVNRMNGYVDKLQTGKPVSGLFNEFSEVVRRVFPNSR